MSGLVIAAGQANYTVFLNRAVASVHVGLFAIAMLLWSIAWALSGTMTLEARHGALLVTLVQMLWTVVAAAALLTAKRE